MILPPGSHQNQQKYSLLCCDNTLLQQKSSLDCCEFGIVMHNYRYGFVHYCCRSPHGERGLK